MTAPIVNGESGFVVREKLNLIIEQVDTLVASGGGGGGAAAEPLTGAEIKTAYEGEANTNAFTDTEQTKLAGIAAGAEVNTINSSTISSIVSLTQAAYDALTPVSTTFYVITD